MQIINIFHYPLRENAWKFPVLYFTSVNILVAMMLAILFFGIPKTSFGDDPGPPLFLTPLIEANRTDDARIASAVYFNGFKKQKSFSGYFTVDKIYNSNLFFWFFPSESDYKNDPLIVWLQGDLGTSSLVGLFLENGPFSVKTDHGLKEREFSWTKNHSVLYIDSPVNSGYSFTEEGYAKNQSIIADHLFNALGQFYKVFPELNANNKVVLSGEGISCKTVAYLAKKINKYGTNINLKGLMIENGFCDPINQVGYSNFLYQIGLIDNDSLSQLEDLENQVVNNIKTQNYTQAFIVFNSIFKKNDSFLRNITGFEDFDNFLNPLSLYSYEKNLVFNYVQRDDVRAALHVGNQTYFIKNANVTRNIMEDLLQSAALPLAELLENYKILFYNGQLDPETPYTLLQNFLEHLNFTGADDYKQAKRHFFKDSDEELAGYYKNAANITEVLLRNAGHFTAADQPEWVFNIVFNFTRNVLT